MARPKPKADEPLTYILTLSDGNARHLTVPRSWRLTFGKGGAVGKPQLRLYEGTKLAAVWCDVEHLTRADLQVEERKSAANTMGIIAGESANEFGLSLGQIKRTSRKPVLRAEDSFANSPT